MSLRRRAAVLIVLGALAGSTPAAAQRVKWIEVHGGYAGGSSALDSGGEIGVMRDWTDSWTSLGLGASWIAGETKDPTQNMWAMVLSSNARLHVLGTKIRPYVEAGVNLYVVGYEDVDEDERERSFVNPGLSFGAGAAWHARPELDVRIGAAFHYPKVDLGAGEGENWVTGLVGVSFR